VSAAGGVQNAPRRAARIGATAFALFLKNQLQWVAPEYSAEKIQAFRDAMENGGYTAADVLPHAAYLINLASPDDEKRDRSVAALVDEMRRARLLGLTTVNVHPGSTTGEADERTGLRLVADSLSYALRTEEDVTVVLENTAGQGNTVGYRFEHLARIIELVGGDARIGVCLDTAHMLAAGYDLRTAGSYRWVLDHFHQVIGLSRLFGIHANDSAFGLGSRRDRHARVGEGYVGIEAFARLMRDPRLRQVPVLLETPDERRWREEVHLLVRLAATAGNNQQAVRT
jgi:deoxyribonuclease-4